MTLAITIYTRNWSLLLRFPLELDVGTSKLLLLQKSNNKSRKAEKQFSKLSFLFVREYIKYIEKGVNDEILQLAYDFHI